MRESLPKSPFDESRPPFCVIPGQSAADAAADIVAAFDLLDGLPAPVQSVYAAIARRLGPAGWSVPMDVAARALAALADGHTLAFDVPPYHGTRHYCEVMLSSCFLVQWHGLVGAEAQAIVLAALIHDLGHDGELHPPFVMERSSLARALPALRVAAVPAADVKRLGWLVLATEPSEGVAMALASLRPSRPGVRPLPAPAGAPQLQGAADDPALARLAMVLCEADVLPSIGLTLAHAQRVQARLAREWRRPLGPVDKLHFAESQLERGVIGPFFRSNVESLCRHLSTSVHEIEGR